MKSFAASILLVAALVTLFFLHALMPASVRAALIIGAWLLLPYALLALGLRFLARDPRSVRVYAATSICVAIGGVVFLTWVIYVQPDPQGAIAVVFTPIYQLIGVVLVLPLWRRYFDRRPN